jgi:hypothetical protein
VIEVLVLVIIVALLVLGTFGYWFYKKRKLRATSGDIELPSVDESEPQSKPKGVSTKGYEKFEDEN